MKLQIDLRHYWHVGTGSGRGGHLDALVRRDAAGLPMLPGRALKGLLRDAVRTAALFGWYPHAHDVETDLFGSRSQVQDTLPQDDPSDHTRTGWLRVGDARLPDDLRHALLQDPGFDAAPFFGEMYSTAIDDDSGTARTHSLRGIEVAVPMTLEAPVDLLPNAPPEAHVASLLELALPLVRGVGAHRHRGYGRAVVTLVNAVGARA